MKFLEENRFNQITQTFATLRPILVVGDVAQHLDLVGAGDLVLDRILHRVDGLLGQSRQRLDEALEAGRLARAGDAGQQHDALAGTPGQAQQAQVAQLLLLVAQVMVPVLVAQFLSLQVQQAQQVHLVHCLSAQEQQPVAQRV